MKGKNWILYADNDSITAQELLRLSMAPGSKSPTAATASTAEAVGFTIGEELPMTEEGDEEGALMPERDPNVIELVVRGS